MIQRMEFSSQRKRQCYGCLPKMDFPALPMSNTSLCRAYTSLFSAEPYTAHRTLSALLIPLIWSLSVWCGSSHREPKLPEIGKVNTEVELITATSV